MLFVRFFSVVCMTLFFFGGLTNSIAQPKPEEGLELYYKNNLREAINSFSEYLERNPNNITALTYFAESLRRIDSISAALIYARKALALEPCNSMALNTVSDSYNEQFGWEGSNRDTSWRYIIKAVACNPNDGNPWLDVWIGAMYRNDVALEQKALRRLFETGFYSKSTLAFNRWILQSLPQNCILFTNGDLDTYPALSLQQVEVLRKDVTIINLSLLNLPWYARLMSARANIDTSKVLKGFFVDYPKYDENQNEIFADKQFLNMIIKGIREHSLINRISFAVTVGNSFLKEFKTNLIYVGPSILFDPLINEFQADYNKLKMNLAKIKSTDFIEGACSEQDRSPVRRANPSGHKMSIIYSAAIYLANLKEDPVNRIEVSQFKSVWKAFILKTIPTEEIETLDQEIKEIFELD